MRLFTKKKERKNSLLTLWKILLGLISPVYSLITGSQITPDETQHGWKGGKKKLREEETDSMFIDGANSKYPIKAPTETVGRE